MKKIFFLLLTILCHIQLSAQDLQITNCIVNPTDGSVTIDWNYTGLAANFQHYTLFRKTDANPTPIQLSSFTNYTDNTYTDNSAVANQFSITYILEVTLLGGISEKDSLKTILLTVSNKDNKYAELNWTPPKTNVPFSYEICRFIRGNTCLPIATTSLLSYQDTIPTTCDTIQYSINIKNPFSCVSNKAGSYFIDTEIPDTPLFDSVSINPINQKITLGWKRPLANDVKGYIICEGSPCLLIDTIWGGNITHHTWNIGNSNKKYSFRISAFDSCMNPSILTEVHNNIVLSESIKECSRDITLTWNKYQNLYPSVESYTLYVQKDNQEYEIVEKLSSNTESYTYTLPGNVEDVCFYIKVSNPGSTITASSNIVCKNLSSLDTPGILYLREASVAENNKNVELKIFTKGSFSTSNHNIYRYVNNESPAKIASIPNNGNEEISYTDDNANISANPYYYFVSIQNSCNETIKKSNIAKTICLKLEEKNINENTLTWNSYEGWQSITGYEVYRKTKSTLPVFLGSVNDGSNTYTDNLSNLTFSETLIYYVLANESTGNPHEFQDQVQSSSAHYTKQGILAIPNAFTPKALTNNVFKPLLLFTDERNYSFVIFNRWGELIFETKNIHEGWNGTFKNKYVPIGAYVYKINCFFSNGEKYSKTGIVNVID